jgi:hypothetical protein
MTRKRWSAKAMAEPRRRAMQLHLAGFTQEEIAEKVGTHRSIVCRALRWIRDSSCPGQSPDVQEACFIQIERMKFNPEGSQFDPRNPPSEKSALPVLGAKCGNCRMGFSPSMARFSGRRAKAHPTATPRTGRAEKSLSPDEAAAAWKDRKIHEPLVDGYGLN